MKEKVKFVAGPGIKPGTLALDADALPTALRGPATQSEFVQLLKYPSRQQAIQNDKIILNLYISYSVQNTSSVDVCILRSLHVYPGP